VPNGFPFKYALATPTSYIIAPFSGFERLGVVATINTMKYFGSFLIFWNVQVNYQLPPETNSTQ
jgi:hypothetical protein